MEKYFVCIFVCLCVLLWVVEIVLRKSFRPAGEWMLRIGPGTAALAVLILDGFGRESETVAFLLAADILFLSTVFLQSFLTLPDRGFITALTVLLTVVCLLRSLLSASGYFTGTGCAGFMTVSSSVLLSAGVFADTFSAARERDAFRSSGPAIPVKLCFSQVLSLSAVLVAVFGYGAFPCSRTALLILSLLLSSLYAYLYISSSVGRDILQVPVPPAVPRQESKAMDESERMDLLFKKVEAYMQKNRPYLDDSFTLAGLASEMLTNKGMLSKTINTMAGRNFCQYVNGYRIRYAVSLMKKDHRLRVVELSLMSGFHSVASFNMAFKLFMNDTPSEYMRTLHAREQLHTGRPQDNEG